jgi:RNA polymerase sigma-70 factor (ECF subfamily)
MKRKRMLVNAENCLYNVTKVREKASFPGLDEIVAKYRPIVSYRVKKSIGMQTPDWEDVVNEIMLNMIDKLNSGDFRGDSSIGTYIYTITSRRIVDFIRQKSKALKYAPEPPSAPTPIERVENRERAKLVARNLEKLKPKYKEILYLYYYRDLSREEVSEKLGIPPRRVSERIHYAQKLLRKLIAK